MFIPELDNSIPDLGSQIQGKKGTDPELGSATKNFRIFNSKIVTKPPDIYPGSEFFFHPRPGPGSRGQKSTGSWIRISKTLFSTFVSMKFGTRFLPYSTVQAGWYPFDTEASNVSDF
jgi:hypothetical protein